MKIIYSKISISNITQARCPQTFSLVSFCSPVSELVLTVIHGVTVSCCALPFPHKKKNKVSLVRCLNLSECDCDLWRSMN